MRSSILCFALLASLAAQASSESDVMDAWSGYYETSPTQLRLLAVVGDEGRDADVNPSMLPKGDPADVFTHGTLSFVVHAYPAPDPTTVSASLWSSEGDGSMMYQVNLRDDGWIYKYQWSQPRTFWPGFKSCVKVESYQLHGLLPQTPPPETLHKGRLRIIADVKTELFGDCTGALANVRACLQDIRQCPGDNEEQAAYHRQTATDALERFLENGLIKPSELDKLNSFSYSISFE